MKNTEKINAGDLAKLIVICISNFLFMTKDKRLTPRQMETLKQSVERDLVNGEYKKAPMMYDQYVYNMLN